MRMQRVELKLTEFFISSPEPTVVNLPGVGVPKLVKTDWVLMTQQIWTVIFRSGLMKPVAVYHGLTKVCEASAKVHVVGLVRRVALAVGVGEVDHSLHQLAVEDHAAAAGLRKNTTRLRLVSELLHAVFSFLVMKWGSEYRTI